MIEFVEPMLACHPTAIMAVSLVMQAAGAAANYAGQRQAAAEQQAYQDHLAEMQQQAALRKVSSLNIKIAQEQEATARKIESVRLESDRVAAQSRLSAEAGGVTGLSIQHLIQTHEAQEGRYMFALQEEQKMREANAERMSGDIMLGAAQQMAATQAPISQPSMLASAMKFGAGAAGTLLDSGIFDADPSKKTSRIS